MCTSLRSLFRPERSLARVVNIMNLVAGRVNVFVIYNVYKMLYITSKKPSDNHKHLVKNRFKGISYFVIIASAAAIPLNTASGIPPPGCAEPEAR